MPRIKIDLPDQFTFSTVIDIRITDINYGGHVGNDTILSIIHEARTRFLKNYGYTELNLDGPGLIMSDAGVEFKNELFYGESVIVSVTVSEFTKAAFEIYYKLEKKKEEATVVVAIAKTGMVCYDYQKRKIAPIPEGVKIKLSGR